MLCKEKLRLHVFARMKGRKRTRERERERGGGGGGDYTPDIEQQVQFQFRNPMGPFNLAPDIPKPIFKFKI